MLNRSIQGVFNSNWIADPVVSNIDRAYKLTANTDNDEKTDTQ